jgi:serine/threonine-protein kinase
LLAVLGAGWVNDPQRELETIESELRAGRKVTLVGETGRPRWSRWREGANSVLTPRTDGPFDVHTFSTVLLELLPEVPVEQYRLRALIRHYEGKAESQVGLYVAHRVQVDNQGQTIHSFLGLTLNDMVSVAQKRPELDKKVNRPTLSVWKLKPKGSGDDGVLSPLSIQSGKAFKPTGNSTTAKIEPWREIVVEMRPHSVLAWWEGQAMGTTKLDDILKNARQQNAGVGDKKRGIDPELNWHAGIGMFVNEAAVMFKAVVIEPLPGLD